MQLELNKRLFIREHRRQNMCENKMLAMNSLPLIKTDCLHNVLLITILYYSFK